MQCDEFEAMVDHYWGGELQDAEAAEVEAHAGSCPRCRVQFELGEMERDALRGLADSSACSGAFMARLGEALDAAGAEAARSGEQRWQRWATAASVGFALLLGAGGVAGLHGVADASSEVNPPAPVQASVYAPLVDEVVRRHQRPIPLEVLGANAEAVTAWFSGKVDFPVAPPNFRRDAHLIGARLSHVNDADAAMLVYDADGSKLTVMLFDAGRRLVPPGQEGEAPLFVAQASGYAIAFHLRNNVAYVFTSELPADRLRALVEAAVTR
jgi:anti-sigma factor RsiW